MWAQVKEFKMEIKNKFYIESITFTTFKTLNTQLSKKTLYIWLLNLCPKAQVKIFQKGMIQANNDIGNVNELLKKGNDTKVIIVNFWCN